MNMQTTLFILLAAFVFVMVVLMGMHRRLAEQFVDAPTTTTTTTSESERQQAALSSVCPSDAYQDEDGTIHVLPGGQTFKSMVDYANFMSAFYAKNKGCGPVPAVKPYAGGPVSGILGGLGTGTASPNQIAGEGADRSVLNTALDRLYELAGAATGSSKQGGNVIMMDYPGEQTSAKTPINSLDDYEYNRVFEIENRDRMSPLSKQQVDTFVSQYQLDWSALPFSSEERSQYEEAFVDARMADGFREPKTGVFFKNMEGADIAPPNEDEQSAREAKILSAYQPTDITKHVVDSEFERVAKVVEQQYSTDADWEPVVEKRGDHQYAVTELRPRRRKQKDGKDGKEEEVEWEENTAPTIEKAKDQGLVSGGSLAPHITVDANLQDPFFDKNGVVDYTNNRFWRYQDFNKWTPGLERMFAPTNETKAWF